MPCPDHPDLAQPGCRACDAYAARVLDHILAGLPKRDVRHEGTTGTCPRCRDMLRRAARMIAAEHLDETGEQKG